MKIRGKLLLSFGLFAFLGVVVGVIALVSSSKTNSLYSEEQVATQFNLEIKDILVAHLGWRNALSADFLNNTPSISVQADHQKCVLGQLLYNGRLDQINQLDPELGRLLEDLKQPHKELHSSVHKINADYQQIHSGLRSTLLARLDEHNIWAAKISDGLINNLPFDVQIDPTLCRFGKWLASEECLSLTEQWPDFATQVAKIKQSHETLHTSAKLIQDEPLAQNKTRIFQQKTTPALTMVRTGITALITSETERVSGQSSARKTMNSETRVALEVIKGKMAGIVSYGDDKIEEAANKLTKMRRTQTTTINLTILILIISSGILGWRISHGIATPIAQAVELAIEIGQGDTSRRLENQNKDETGLLTKAMNNMADNLEAKVNLADKIADGDLTAEIALASEKDKLGLALKTMTAKLKNIIDNIQRSTQEMESGASEIASASQDLAMGATTSAASLEEISASLTDINSKVADNASSAKTASERCISVQQAAQTAEASIGNMNTSMTHINEGSKDIEKVIKVIDDIAFQTNLLALNAAVEAARAGKHGKGFAVVAEEVRDLAGRSAKAARETSEMITESIQRANEGSSNLEEVNSSFGEISEGLVSIVGLIEDIARSSEDQAAGISEITEGTKQLDSTTQRNSATSEETAAAAEELSAVAGTLTGMTRQFMVSNNEITNELPEPMVDISRSSPDGWPADSKNDQLVQV